MRSLLWLSITVASGVVAVLGGAVVYIAIGGVLGAVAATVSTLSIAVALLAWLDWMER